MTIKYKIGNLIDAAKSGEVTHIAHQANCFHTMGAGIAPQIKKAFPAAWQADCETTERGDPTKMGTYSKGTHIMNGLPEFNRHIVVYNIYGQYGADYKGLTYGTKYWALANGLNLMYEDILDDISIAHEVPIRVGLPKLGCGLAGGDWAVVEAIIENVFTDIDVTIYVLTEDELPEYERVRLSIEKALNNPHTDIILKEGE